MLANRIPDLLADNGLTQASLKINYGCSGLFASNAQREIDDNVVGILNPGRCKRYRASLDQQEVERRPKIPTR